MVNDTLNGFAYEYDTTGDLIFKQKYQMGILLNEKIFKQSKELIDVKNTLSNFEVSKKRTKNIINTILEEIKNREENYEQTLLEREMELKNANLLISKQENEKQYLNGIIESQKTEKELLETKNKFKSFIVGASSLAILLLILLYSNTNKKNKIISQQKRNLLNTHESLRVQHKEISDSIKYAERLQLAILPSKEEFYDKLKNSFILFQPKDVVSGDFYWMEKVNDTVFFAAADCTGHGVPGAMVSVVCSNALSRSVNEFNISEPSKILDKTRELVIQTFSKSGEDVKDGMDIALCTFNDKSVVYAGANNPLWIIRQTPLIEKEQKEMRSTVTQQNFSLIEFKASKQPIGLYEGMKKFTQKEIKLQRGDTLYIFTDGFADQFGGPKGKKFMYRSFKKLLLNMVNTPMDKQQQIILSEFNNWRGSEEQVDDVCIIGVRV